MRVILADDQVWLRSALRLLLEHESNTEIVGEAGNARALALLAQRLHPELLFLDWQLPGLDTISARHHLISMLREHFPELFIIALTNDDKNAISLPFGADAFVNRAEPPDRILSVVRQAVTRFSGALGTAAENRSLH